MNVSILVVLANALLQLLRRSRNKLKADVLLLCIMKRRSVMKKPVKDEWIELSRRVLCRCVRRQQESNRKLGCGNRHKKPNCAQSSLQPCGCEKFAV
jgi:hypothetical protein